MDDLTDKEKEMLEKLEDVKEMEEEVIENINKIDNHTEEVSENIDKVDNRISSLKESTFLKILPCMDTMLNIIFILILLGIIILAVG